MIILSRNLKDLIQKKINNESQKLLVKNDDGEKNNNIDDQNNIFNNEKNIINHSNNRNEDEIRRKINKQNKTKKIGKIRIKLIKKLIILQMI